MSSLMRRKMSNPTTVPVDPEAVAKLAEQFMTYGDAITAFVVAQAVAFAYVMGTQNSLRQNILRAWSKTVLLSIVAGGVYMLLIAGCARAELRLRAEACQPSLVQEWACYASIGRLLIVALMTGLTLVALVLSRPKKGV